jgi:CIC family chloride channel protein
MELPGPASQNNSVSETSKQRRIRIPYFADREEQLFLFLTIVIGVLVGLAVVAFILVTERLGARIYNGGTDRWHGLVWPVVGSLVAGYLLWRYFPAAAGSGVPQTKASFFSEPGYVPLRTVLGKFLCTSLSLSSGIPLGREGPSVQVGGGIASLLGRWLGLSQDKVRSLIPVGASAALAAAFNTPIAAVLFTLEEIVGDLHAPVLGSVVLSAATSWMVLRLSLGNEPLFHAPQYQLVHPSEFGIYAILGLAGGLVSALFCRLLLDLRTRFLRLPKKTGWLQPVVGGLLVGVAGWYLPQSLGVGYHVVGDALAGNLALRVLVVLLFVKLLTVCLAYASGNAGGIFAPSLFIGATLGGTIGTLVHQYFPAHTATSGAYALVGMGAVFAGIIRTPMTSVIMIFELTRDYAVIVPLMIANLVSLYVASRFQHDQIYELLALQDGIHLPAARTRRKLRERRVAHAMRAEAECVPGELTVREAWPRVAPRPKQTVLVSDARGLAGVITRATLENALRDGRENSTVLALLPAGDFPHVHPDHELHLALERLGASGLDVLPVVSRKDIRRLLGVIHLDDVLSLYGVRSGSS